MAEKSVPSNKNHLIGLPIVLVIVAFVAGILGGARGKTFSERLTSLSNSAATGQKWFRGKVNLLQVLLKMLAPVSFLLPLKAKASLPQLTSCSVMAAAR